MFLRHPVLMLMGLLASACWVESDPPPQTHGSRGYDPSASASTSTPPSATPLLVKVDTGRTLNAQPGEGVGIFVEYAAGGKWHVWWTCDTKQTGVSCDFYLRIKSESGDLESIQSEGALATDSIVSSDARTIDARSSTGANSVGVHFQGPAKGVIAIEALVGSVADPSFFFFVQDGKPNGGFSGALTNPIRFQGSNP